MAPPRVVRLVSGAALLLAGARVVPAFVPAARGHVDGTAALARLRGAAPSSVAGTDTADAPSAGAALAALGLAAFALAAGTSGKERRQPATPRHFFGGAPPPPPSKPTSYKDFQDPWLGSADLGFDPLSLAVGGGVFDKGAAAVPETTYYNYRESEVKHGRFAMGAFLAIFAESDDRGALFKQLGAAGAEDKLDATLGLDEVQAPVLLIGLGYQALAEYNLQRRKEDGDLLSVQYKKDRIPGNLGFDPLGLGSGQGADIVGLHNTEVNAGRLAMVGVTAFLFKEFVVKDAAIASKIL